MLFRRIIVVLGVLFGCDLCKVQIFPSVGCFVHRNSRSASSWPLLRSFVLPSCRPWSLLLGWCHRLVPTDRVRKDGPPSTSGNQSRLVFRTDKETDRQANVLLKQLPTAVFSTQFSRLVLSCRVFPPSDKTAAFVLNKKATQSKATSIIQSFNQHHDETERSILAVALPPSCHRPGAGRGLHDDNNVMC